MSASGLVPARPGGAPCGGEQPRRGARAWARVARWVAAAWVGPERTGAGCAACGTCCELFGGHLRATKLDLERWRAQGRADLLGQVNRLGWLWVDPSSGAHLDRCPHLEKTGPAAARCLIHETKPEMCRAYPTLAHGRRCVRGGVIH